MVCGLDWAVASNWFRGEKQIKTPGMNRQEIVNQYVVINRENTNYYYFVSNPNDGREEP